MLAGDILYRDVWDNKDPLFYLSIAAGRAISPYADVAMEVGWMLCAGGALVAIGRWLGCDLPVACFVGLGLAPLILAGRLYIAGATHLPGIAVTLLIVAVTLRGRYALAGALMAGLLFLKIIMVPVAFIIMLIILIHHRKWRGFGFVAFSFAISFGFLLAFMQMRGELQPYIESLRLNVSYSQGSVALSEWGPVVGHLQRVIAGGAISITVAIAFILVWQISGRDATRCRLFGPARTVWACILGSLVAAYCVLGLTGVWVHHGQILYVPALLAAIAAAYTVQSHLGSLGLNRRSALRLFAFTSLSLMLSGLGPHLYLKSWVDAPAALASLASAPSETTAILSIAKSGTYARVGSNDDAGHARGLENWDLACPRFHQYPFDSREALTGVADCLSTADVIVVTQSAVGVPGNSAWNHFIERVDSLLKSEYKCSPSGTSQVCVRPMR